MKNTYITTAEYIIKPRVKKQWFRKDRVVYDLVLKSIGERWCDPSYGNGGGDYIPFEDEEVIHTCDTLVEAEGFKNKMTLGVAK